MTTISNVPRDQNRVSDYLAKFARIDGRTVVLLGFGTPEVVDLCRTDCNLDVS